MPNLYKADYKRYGVQMPLDASSQVEEIARVENKSASQVIVEKFIIGLNAEKPQRLVELHNDELALLRAARLALEVMHGPAATREAAVEALTRHVIQSGLRRTSEEKMAAEVEQANYESKKPLAPSFMLAEEARRAELAKKAQDAAKRAARR